MSVLSPDRYAARVVEKASTLLGARTSRRGFLARTSLAATALSVAPAEFLLHPVDAYAAICSCGGESCDCGSACCDGYTEFCCTIHEGSNVCPPGTFPGGWWRADGSAYCNGPRYYIDCQAECHCNANCGPGNFCGPGCDGLTCKCAFGDCNNRRAGCVTFRYGQCHAEIGCSGRIACRVVTCTPAYLVDNSCGTETFYDDFTANHNRPCLQWPERVVRTYGFASRKQGGEWLTGLDGGVFTYDGAPFFGSMGGHPLNQPVVGMAPTPSGRGYWLVALDGGIFTFGDAVFHGSAGNIPLFAPMVGMAATPSGNGYWLVASDGGVFTYGDAGFHGSIGGHFLDAPVVGMAATPSGNGYWLVASDGGVFTFGDAGFYGSMGASGLSAPVTGIFPTATARGYYLLGQDGAVYCFGDAVSWGSYFSLPHDPSLLANGVDSFYGMVLSEAGGTTTGYRLIAVAGNGAPPAFREYTCGTFV